ncbi:MaoC family dehydratase N-terminal domain-containing protein [Shouchella patagoniensis]|uniref:MaoC family dehydratase N-terminal domain-containing protein n=1 Tax=Shouchella patagoniensis TaxID=228576 RepID=UPI000995C4D2|nr:MaoC family dehydratase N-terminal domain-containing protein [Shouchella patagoniensis]
MFKQLIGIKSQPTKNIVERGAVKAFAQSIGDAHPLYVDEAYGEASLYGQNIAPPTFPRVFDYGEMSELKLPDKGLIHGEQTYEYVRPLLVGETVSCYSEVADYVEKKGKSGTMGLLSVKSVGLDDKGKQLFSSKQVIILTETVRRAMKV